ncbi:MAG: hypothetical protein ABGZ24_29230, partial [Fuerstiella sp.]
RPAPNEISLGPSPGVTTSGDVCYGLGLSASPVRSELNALAEPVARSCSVPFFHHNDMEVTR